jgi:hypothetical protein|tara:strand:- start:70 stop:651 length:582 start_codon:yes stop_codon:yes gene_type:complete
MKKILTAVIAATMLMPSMTLASSIRPGSRITHDSLNSNSRKSISNCLVLVDDGEYVEEKWEKCEVVIDETGVTHPSGKIIRVVQWTTEEKEFSVGGGIVGGAAGASVGFAAGLGSCAFLGPFCLITAPAIMNGGMMVGGTAGGKGTGKFFTIVGDDINGRRLILEVYFKNGKAVRKAFKDLLRTTKLAEGEVR